MCKLNIIKSLAALPGQVEFLCGLGQLAFPNLVFLMRKHVLQDKSWLVLFYFFLPLS